MLGRRLLAASLVLALSAPLAVLADPPAPATAPTPEATEQARSHYKQGKAYQDIGAYDQAIAEYMTANSLAPRPELYFNIAQCHRLAGHTDEAIRYYHLFVEAMPGAAGADEARMYIARLEQQRKAERERRAAEAARRPPAPAQVASENESPTGRTAVRWIGVGGVAAGVALIGVGAYFGTQASSEGDALAAVRGPWTPELAARESAAMTDETRMWILIGGGSALVLGGAALWWWGGKHGALEAAPSVAPGHAGLVLRGRFQ